MISIAELLQEKEKLQQAERQYRKQRSKPERKDYLSKHDRDELILLAAMASKMEEIIEAWYKHGRPRERIKYGKTALTYVYKAMDTYFTGMTEKEKEKEALKAIRYLRDCKITLETPF